MIRAKRYLLFSIAMTLIGAVALSGCEPLRKKFVRKKKKDQNEEFIPVLDPIDYPPARVLSSEKYAYHFSMWQVWSKDLRLLIGDDTMDKRKKYLLSQMLTQLLELKKWTPQEFLPKLDEAMGGYDRIQKEMEKPESMRNLSFIDGQLRRLESFLRNDLDPDMVYPKSDE